LACTTWLHDRVEAERSFNSGRVTQASSWVVTLTNTEVVTPLPEATTLSTRMTSTLLRSAVRTRTSNVLRLSSRGISATSARWSETDRVDAKKAGFGYHTVEDLHGMTAHEILSGPKEDPKMRHFTGMLYNFYWSTTRSFSYLTLVNFG